MHMSPFRIPAFLAINLVSAALWSNNIQVSNVSLNGQNPATDTWQVAFDLSWDNSWRTSSGESNYDAAWVFIKYRFGPNTDWRHATLSPSGHIVSALATVASDQRGVFIHRGIDGIGTMSLTNSQLRWNYSGTGVGDNDPIEVRVFAIEMVRVPQGSFAAGDGATSDFQRHFGAGNSNDPFIFTSEAALNLGGFLSTSLGNRNNVDSGSGADDDFSTTVNQTLPAGFPKGFNAFFMMKYECSEGQYVDFLNMLTPAQANNRFPNTTGTLGNTIDDSGTPPELYVTSAPERAASMRGTDLLAYADWAALRPMTELEFEKGCRGNRPVVEDEYAWGSTSLRTTPVYGVFDAGTANETVNAVGTEGNANYSIFITPNRPARVGIFAGSLTNPDRAAAGAGYYGAMELSGNLPEMVINVGTPQGRAFTGASGDGTLDASGAATVAGWPTSGLPLAVRGGGTGDLAVRLRVSDRHSAVNALSTAGKGARLCRFP
ncbi:MAG: hypothetical protein IPJ76_15625 [Flavobacteriales bacterium]|nr:MAG: hypothetical protein IPJ76_15625 [Flavobacteriales bacterium]